MGHIFRLFALAPVLIIQALYVRKVTPRLPEPEGDRQGHIQEAYSLPELSILIVGDSSAAGVGVSAQFDALAGQLSQTLSKTYNLRWQLLAKTGATSEDGLRWIQQQSRAKLDVVISVFGVNDVTHLHSVSRWQAEQHALFEAIQLRFGQPHVIACGLPPVSRFPALPQPLRWHLGKRARQFDALLLKLTDIQPRQHYCALDFSVDEQAMASDGFHPGIGIYQTWAIKLAKMIQALV